MQDTPAQVDAPDVADVEAPPSITGVQRRRSELRAAMSALETSLAARLDDPAEWRADVARRVEVLCQAFERHVQVHEGADSFHAEILRVQPYLSARVASLQRDHRRLEGSLAELTAVVADSEAGRAVDEIQGRAADVLHRLSKHRRRGADVVWEAFNTDLGGET